MSDSVSLDEIRVQRAKGWPDFHPEDYCHRCGRPNCGWWADSDRWNLATADLPRRHMEILCPSCFVELWEEAIGLKATWQLVPTNIRHGSNP